MGAGGFPIDIVLFGMIAVFLVVRLRGILGRRSGFERPAEPRGGVRGPGVESPVIDGVAERVTAPPPAPARVLPDPATPVGQELTRMTAIDRNFQPARFLDGAEAAFRIIVTAFAAGARDTLRPLLSEHCYTDFEAAITAREAAGETQRTEVRAIENAAIESAELRGSTAVIGVRFVSDQVNITMARDGSVAAGTDAVTEIADHWIFERDLTATDPTWRLVAARNA